MFVPVIPVIKPAPFPNASRSARSSVKMGNVLLLMYVPVPMAMNQIRLTIFATPSAIQYALIALVELRTLAFVTPDMLPPRILRSSAHLTVKLLV